MYRVRKTVAAFDLGEEALGDEEPLLFNGGREHHIIPQDDGPAELAPAGDGKEGAPDTRTPRTRGDVLPLRRAGKARKRTKTERGHFSALPTTCARNRWPTSRSWRAKP